MGRKRKKRVVTYDSKEIYTFIGLVLLLTGLFFFISVFTVSENDGNLFVQTKSIFGDSTIITSLFLAFVGLSFLGAHIPFTKKSSLAGQLGLVVLIPALITSFSTTPRELSRLTGDDVAGGEVGYYIIKDFLGDTIPTEPITKIILIAATAIILPIALSMSLTKLVNVFGKIIRSIGRMAGIILTEEEREELRKLKEAEAQQEQSQEHARAKTFGDFNKLRKKEPEQELLKQSTSPEITKPLGTPTSMKRLKSEKNVAIKEGAVGEEGLQQTELKYPDWKLPPLSLLIPYKKTKAKEASIDQNAHVIEEILESFGIEAKVEEAFIGPSVVQYALNIPIGVKVSKIYNLSENLSLALGVDSKAIRIENIPETSFLGIEVPRSNRDIVRFKELMESREMQGTEYRLPVPIGKDINGSSVTAGIEKMPHLLIAGATGSGKSVLTNTFISSLLMHKTPDELKLILVDPKQVELSDYNGIPHLLTPVITDMDKVLNALKWAVGEMDRRYSILAENQVRDIRSYNKKKGFAAMPYIVIVIDEMADMMMTGNRGDTETAIVRLAQKARAVGIHLILATQRPSVNVITGIIKANIPGRVGMSVTSSTDSRVILDRIGAESLMGYGDLLYKAPDKTKAIRLQSAFVDQEEVIRIVDFIKSQAPEVEYISEILEKHISDEEAMTEALGDISDDNLVEQAIRIVVAARKGSASYLQRRLNIGFNRAARLLDELEEAGVVGPANGPKPREVLIDNADAFIMQLRGE